MNEEYLISGLIQKDESVFDVIFKYYYSSLCAYALNYVKDDSVAEDIVQGLFVKLWMNTSLKINSSLKSYLFTTVKNVCLDYLKHEKVKQRHVELTGANEGVVDSPPMYVEQELEHILAEAIEKLPSKCQEVFKMSRYQGYSNQEIADHLGISKRTVDKHITNALSQLREELKDYLPLLLISLFLK